MIASDLIVAIMPPPLGIWKILALRSVDSALGAAAALVDGRAIVK
jgi:hypothetical protein